MADQDLKETFVSKALSASDILSAPDLKVVAVEVPEWGGTLYMRGLNGAERDAWEAAMVAFDDDGEVKRDVDKLFANIRARLLVKCLVDEGGNRIFKDKDAAALGQKSAAVLDRLYERAQKLSGLSDEDIADLEGN